MANIAIFRINYKSDFILTLNSDAGWMTPFCIKFWTSAPSHAYFVGFDGTTYTHCSPVAGEPTKLQVQFDDHHLPIGDMKFQIGYHFTVADFPTSVEDEVINQASVIIEVDDAPAQVMLDLNGETAPEIEFSLPAYANEAQRIANEQARIAAEQQRIANEDARIQAEETRQHNEQQRIRQEEARVSEFATLKSQSQEATSAANTAAALANEKAALAADKAALAGAAATLANAKAQLAADKAALADAAATLANDKAALAQQKAEYAQQQGDYAKAQGDTALADHRRAESDHTTAADDHTRADSDHGIAADDHTQAGNDHTRAESDHTRAEQDHTDVQNAIESADLVYDISKANAVGGVLATYADLAAALGTNGANVPQNYRQGGMSVKYVRSSDNKYVQYMLTNKDWSIDIDDWISVGGGSGAYDISAAHSGATYDNLTAALSGTNVPESVRTGGMSVKYIENVYADYSVVVTEGLETQPTGTALQSAPSITDGVYKASQLSAFSPLPIAIGASNTYYIAVTGDTTTYTKWVVTKMTADSEKYVQYRLTAISWSTNTADWQGVDDEPTAGSDNLVKSGGVFEVIKDLLCDTPIYPENRFELGSKVSVTNTKGFWLYNDNQNKIRGKKIFGIVLNIKTVGTLSILKDTGVYSTPVGDFNPTLVEVLTINEIGVQNLYFSQPLILSDNEWLGIVSTTDTAGFYFGTAKDVPNQDFYSTEFNRWNAYSNYGLNIGIITEKLEEVEKGKLFGKKLSILGDSISTFRGHLASDAPGYDGASYAYWYPSGNVKSVENTWWKKLINETGMVLLNNCAWSDSEAEGNSQATSTALAGCSDRRIADLGIGGTPDIVICFIGVNDWGHGKALGSFDENSEIPAEGNITNFADGYTILVDKIQRTYPTAKVFCCTLLNTGYTNYDRGNPGVYPAINRNNVALNAFNDIIIKVANCLGAEIIDIRKCGFTFHNFTDYTIGDKLHPNIAGMELLKNFIRNQLYLLY